MKRYSKMIIKKTDALKLIQSFLTAYAENKDDEYIIISADNRTLFIIFDEVNGE